MSNVTTACFLLALIGCISAQFEVQAPWEIIRKGRIKRLSCTVDSSVSLSSTSIHWYRGKPGEAMERILHFAAGAIKPTFESKFARRFNSGIKDKLITLTISGVADDDAATYYCALWRGDYQKAFSSGTRLFVTDGSPQNPKVSGYPASKPQTNGKHVLLCQAREMFPDLVTFTWQAEDHGGQKVDLKAKVLEQRDEVPDVKITSMLIIDKSQLKSNKFTCFVDHFGNKQTVAIPAFQQDEETPDPVPVNTCPTPKVKAKVIKEEEKDEEEEKSRHGVFELSRSLYLFSVTYVMLLVKNIIYFCTILVLLYKRNAAKKEMLRSKDC